MVEVVPKIFLRNKIVYTFHSLTHELQAVKVCSIRLTRPDEAEPYDAW